MTRLLTFVLLLSFLLLPGGYAYSDQQVGGDMHCTSFNRLPAGFFVTAFKEVAQVSKAAAHHADKPDHDLKAIETEEEEEAASSKDSATAVTGVIPYSIAFNPFSCKLTADQLPPDKHLSYSSPAFILFRVIRV